MGQIGIRCAASRTSLWFYLGVAIADDFLDPPFRTDGQDRDLNQLLRLRHPWEGLTLVGSPS